MDSFIHVISNMTQAYNCLYSVGGFLSLWRMRVRPSRRGYVRAWGIRSCLPATADVRREILELGTDVGGVERQVKMTTTTTTD